MAKTLCVVANAVYVSVCARICVARNVVTLIS